MAFTTFRASAAALDAVRSHAVPLTGAADADRGLIDLLAGARFALLGEASHGSTSSIASAPRSPRRLVEKASRGRRRGRLAGRVSRQPLRARPRRRSRRRRRARRLQALPGLDVAQCQRPRVRRLAARVQCRPARGAQSASTASISTACSPRSRPSSPTSTTPTPAAAPRARDRYACFERYAEDTQAYGYETGFDLAERARRRSSASSSSCAAAPPSAPAGTGSTPPTTSTPSRTRAS